MNIEPQYFSWVDWAMVMGAGLAFIAGLIQGFNKEVRKLVIWIVAPILAFSYYLNIADISIMENIETQSLRSAVSFVIVYLSSIVVLGVFLSTIIGLVIGPWSNILAGVLALFKWTLVFSFVIMIFDKSIASNALKPLRSAYLYENIQDISDVFFNKVKQAFELVDEHRVLDNMGLDAIRIKDNDIKKYNDKLKKMNEEFDKFLPKDE